MTKKITKKTATRLLRKSSISLRLQILILLCMLSATSFSQNCIWTTQFSASGVNVSSNSQTVVDFNFPTGTYAVMNFSVAGQYGVATSIGSYLTITDNSNNPIISGPNSLYFTIPTPGLYRVHLSANSGCGTSGSTRIVAIAPTNRALNLDGINDYVTLSNPVTSDFTVEFWMKTTQTGVAGANWYNGTGLVDAESPGFVNDFGTALIGNKFAFGVGNPDATITSTTSVNDGSWHHVAGTWLNNTGVMKIYIDGVLETTGSGSTNPRNASAPINIGRVTSAINYYNGNIDELRIWNRALCQAEIQNNKNGEIPSTGYGLLANYHFNQGVASGTNTSITSLTDDSGNSNSGTLNNFSLTGSTSNFIAPGAFGDAIYVTTFVSPTVSISGANVICNGASTTFTASGNVTNYSWMSGPTTATYVVSPTVNTTYSVVGTNSLGCQSNIATKTLTVSTVSTSTAITNVACNGGSNGIASITASGGVGAYTYLWSNGGTTSSITGLIAGVYTATVTDANSCKSIKAATVTQPSALVTTTAVTNLLCNGGSTGSATITSTGGTGSYAYNWSTGATTSAITGLMAGVYTATVTDANSCTSIKNVTISQPTALVTSTAVTNVLCNGGTGSATVSVSGGTGGYTYSWAPSGGTAAAATSLAAGIYTVTVTDANTCTKTQVANVTQPTVISLSASASNPTICSGNTTTLTATATGGTGAMSYAWVLGPTTSVSVVSPTSTTVYTVNATDANSCAKSATISITANVCAAAEALNFDGSNDEVNLGIALTNTLAASNKITVEAWVYPTTNTGIALIAGNHATSGGPTQFFLRRNGTQFDFAVNHGTAVSVIGGTVALNTWQHVTGVSNGNTMTLYVNALPIASAAVAATNLISTTSQVWLGYNAFNEAFTGSIDEVRIWNVARTQCEISTYKNCEIATTAAGLIANYHFNQGNNAGNNTSVTALTDVSGSAFTGTLTNMTLTGVTSNWIAPGGVVSGYTTPAAAPVVTVNSEAICSGESFTMAPSGADMYAYSNGSAVVTPTTNATYTVTGTNTITTCSNTAVSSVTVNTLPNVLVNSGAICAGQSFTILPGGADTYAFSGGTDVVMPNADATYTVIGTDANGCENTAISSVTVNALPTVIAVTNNTLLCVGETATLSAMGASTYTWSTTENATDIAVSPTVQTTYTVEGTDANGCSNTTTITQDVSLCTGIVTLSNGNSAINIYPNPNNGLFILELTTVSKVMVSNALGQVIVSETFQAGKHNLDIQSESTGVYFVKVIENTKQKTIKIIKQ